MLTLSFLYFALVIPLSEPTAEAQKIHALMSAYHNHHQFNGSILVARHGRVIYQRGFGYADVSRGIVNDPGTRFPLASLTKQFTAALVLKLVASGDLALDATVSHYLPYYRQDTGQRITLHHLLSHSSGLPSYGRDKTFMRTQAKQPVEVTAFVKARCSGDLIFDPGTAVKYSNSGYYLLGAIIEAVTGMSYGEAVQKHLFTPLQMKNSGYGRPLGEGQNQAIGYRQFGAILEPANTIDPSVAYSAGGLYATVKDLFTWNRALYGGKVLTPELLAKMLAPNSGQFGYGVKLGEVNLSGHGPKAFVAHGGGIFGFSHYLIYFPDDDHLIAILSNGGERPPQAEQRILKILYGLPYTMPEPSVTDAVLPLLHKGQKDKALVLAQQLSNDERYVLDADAFHRRGQALLDDGEHAFAVDLYILSTELFPRYGRVFEGLGKAHFAAQNLQPAIEAFKRAYALDPQLEDSKRFLDLMGVPVAALAQPVRSGNTEDLARFTGEYQLSPQRVLRIYIEGGRLMAQPSGQRPVPLVAESETRFQVQGRPARIEFLQDHQGEVISLTLTQGGRKITGKRMD